MLRNMETVVNLKVLERYRKILESLATEIFFFLVATRDMEVSFRFKRKIEERTFCCTLYKYVSNFRLLLLPYRDKRTYLSGRTWNRVATFQNRYLSDQRHVSLYIPYICNETNADSTLNLTKHISKKTLRSQWIQYHWCFITMNRK